MCFLFFVVVVFGGEEGRGLKMKCAMFIYCDVIHIMPQPRMQYLCSDNLHS